MPRLTNQQYLHRQQLLRKLWRTHPGRFGLLTPVQQWDLHLYYQLTHELTHTELLEHRRQISRKHPTLPARAGKAFRLVVDGLGRTSGPTHVVSDGRRIGVRAVVKPEPDVNRLARAVWLLAEYLAAEERTNK